MKSADAFGSPPTEEPAIRLCVGPFWDAHGMTTAPATASTHRWSRCLRTTSGGAAQEQCDGAWWVKVVCR